jgi:hypothetical protein
MVHVPIAGAAHRISARAWQTDAALNAFAIGSAAFAMTLGGLFFWRAVRAFRKARLAGFDARACSAVFGVWASTAFCWLDMAAVIILAGLEAGRAVLLGVSSGFILSLFVLTAYVTMPRYRRVVNDPLMKRW